MNIFFPCPQREEIIIGTNNSFKIRFMGNPPVLCRTKIIKLWVFDYQK